MLFNIKNIVTIYMYVVFIFIGTIVICLNSCTWLHFIIPPQTKFRRVYWFHPVRPLSVDATLSPHRIFYNCMEQSENLYIC